MITGSYCIATAFFLGSFYLQRADGLGKVIFAVNAGGDAHVDIHGIEYQKDPLKVGIASDYGKHLLSVGRVHPNDHILYQTERYHHSNFGYEIPIEDDGNFVMVLKFSEVYFTEPNSKIFDVVLNGDHTVLADLDIFDKVGHGVAYDHVVPFEVTAKGKTLVHNGVESDIRGGKIRVEFLKGQKDNAKVNAIYVIKGGITDVPELPPLEVPKEEEEPFIEPEVTKPQHKPRKMPGQPRLADPYDEVPLTQTIGPVFVAIVVFAFSLLFLCRL